MGWRSKKRSLKIVAELNVVPYIDVMLVLLIIFMATAPLLEEGVPVNLPEVTGEALLKTDLEPIVVSIDHKGSYFLSIAKKSEETIEPEVLIMEVRKAQKEHPERAILVRGDKAVPYGRVLEIVSLLQESGIKSVGLVTQMPLEKVMKP